MNLETNRKSSTALHSFHDFFSFQHQKSKRKRESDEQSAWRRKDIQDFNDPMKGERGPSSPFRFFRHFLMSLRFTLESLHFGAIHSFSFLTFYLIPLSGSALEDTFVFYITSLSSPLLSLPVRYSATFLHGVENNK